MAFADPRCIGLRDTDDRIDLRRPMPRSDTRPRHRGRRRDVRVRAVVEIEQAALRTCDSSGDHALIARAT